ncbi:alpha/beta-hydrolase [Mytilinidion resinicola]|uniref:Alpha/beta-hydrolase n=1 Tax=Mytilinidion resinicola TaxID=574789 RepID=A0A6A6YBK7_9PEZI|nr:alpha/beta-hydrolase [Mytilinidion resinicola]KAF2805394.1 alpha/beta-hydrolase [Mytilinidion resinicola]
MSQTKPTLVFVPGSWHDPSCYSKVIALLEPQSFKSVVVDLPTTQSDRSKNLSDDIVAAKTAIEAEIIAGHDVVVIVWSYGSVVGSSAIQGFTRPKGEEGKGERGHVIGMVYMATGFNPTGVSFLGAFGGKPPPIWNLNEETGFVDLAVDPKDLFYHDIPDEEAKALIAQLRPQTVASLTEVSDLAYSGWLDVPVFYLATIEDKGLPIEAQRMFVQMAKDAGAEVTIEEAQSSHSVMLSQPKQTAEFIVKAVKAFEG